MSTFSQLLSADPPPGFHLLVRYVDQLARSHDMPVVNVELVSETDGRVLDLEKAVVLVSTRKSVVLQQSADSKSIIKVGKADLIDREARIHALVDGGPSIRKLVSTGRVMGVEAKEADPQLRYVELEGLGEPLATKHSADMSTFFDHASAALAHMHKKGVMHRDIKPSNMIVIDGKLFLNDFDCSCLTDERDQLRNSAIGTQEFASPLFSRSFSPDDDWASLLLSFLSLKTDINQKQQILALAVGLDWVPSNMKAVLRSLGRHRSCDASRLYC
jgi:serine/threonine protein kinase